LVQKSAAYEITKLRINYSCDLFVVKQIMCKFKTNAERKTPSRRTLQDTWHCFLALLYFDAAFFLFLDKKNPYKKKELLH